VECKAISPCAPFLVAINVELMNPIEFTVALNNVRGVIQGGERLALWGFLCRACARVFIIERNVVLRFICRDYTVITS